MGCIPSKDINPHSALHTQGVAIGNDPVAANTPGLAGGMRFIAPGPAGGDAGGRYNHKLADETRQRLARERKEREKEEREQDGANGSA